MALPSFPTVRGLKFKGSGTPEIFPILGGTALGSTQGTLGSLESGTVHTSTGPRVRSRNIEAFGEEFVLQGPDIRERNTGGVDNWGIVHSPVFTTTYVPVGADSGWHLLHPAGRPTLAFMYTGLPSFRVGVVFTTDGVNWTTIELALNSGSHGHGDSITYRDSLFWAPGQANRTIVEYNFLTSATTLHIVAGDSGNDFASRGGSFCVHDNVLYFVHGGSFNGDTWHVRRFQGGAFVSQASDDHHVGNGIATQGSCSFPDGADIVSFLPGRAPGFVLGDTVVRWTDVKTSPAGSDIGATVIAGFNIRPGEGSATDSATWEVIVDNDSNPGVPPAIHLWRMPGPAHTGTRIAYTWHYRAMTHDGAEIFTLGEEVTGGTSGARGDVAEISSGKVHLTNIVGVFQNAEVITGTTSSDSATSTSVLTEQNLTQIGTSISADFSLPAALDALGPFVPAHPATRVEIGISGVRLSHGTVTGGPFQVGEVITSSGGGTGNILINNLTNLIIYPTNATVFGAGETLTGVTSGATATQSGASTPDQSVPPTEVVGGTQYYLKVWGITPNPVPVTILYSTAEEQAPWRREAILSVSLAVGIAPGLAPTISGGQILNLPADNGARVWSFVHDADAGGFEAGDIYELAMKGD